MTPPIFSGVGVALVTIFDDPGTVDAPATAALAVQLSEAGVRCVLVAGSNGEAASLDEDERVSLVKTVRDELADDVIVLAGTGAPSARQACHLTKLAVDAGADGVLALSPPQSSDASHYYELVTEAASGTPVLAYHFPGASAPGLDVNLLAELPVAGLKDSSGDVSRLYEEMDVFGGWLYTGSANLVLLAGALGCPGAILGIANLEPELCVRAFAGDADAQLRIAKSGADLASTWPQGLKQAVSARFGVSAVARMG